MTMMNGGLLLVRHDLGMPGPMQLAAAGIAFSLSLFLLVIAAWRQRELLLSGSRRVVRGWIVGLLGMGLALLAGIVIVEIWNG